MSEEGCTCWNCLSFGSVALLAVSIPQCAKMLCALNLPNTFDNCRTYEECAISQLWWEFWLSESWAMVDVHASDFSAADVHVIAALWGSVALCKRFSVISWKLGFCKIGVFSLSGSLLPFCFYRIIKWKEEEKPIPPSPGRRCGSTLFLLCAAVL